MFLLLPFLSLAQRPDAVAPLPLDPRFKADILVVVAHPDDESAISSYLAKAIFDDKRRVAVVYATNGTAGGNFVGREQGTALGLVREIEARQALATLQIANVWFMGLRDTPGQDPLTSLENWGQGNAIEQMTRIIRLTRPEVILAWIPLNIAGEHGDHQAAGIVATEAMDIASDPSMFPAQVAFPIDRLNINNRHEGLEPWQVKKLYFFSELSDFRPSGVGPVFDPKALSPSRGVPYFRLAAIEQRAHLTQAETGQTATRALETGQFGPLTDPITFALGKSAVKTSRTGEIFEGVSADAKVLPAARRDDAEEHPDRVWAELGGAWAYYRKFWRTHGLEPVADMEAPELQLGSNVKIWLPLILYNDMEREAMVSVRVELPRGWREYVGSAVYRLAPRSSVPLQSVVEGPITPEVGEEIITFHVSVGNREILARSLRIRRRTE